MTGSSGLIGSEMSTYFASQGWTIYGIDNNERAVFFGEQGDTTWNLMRMKELLGDKFYHSSIDIRSRKRMETIIQEVQPNAVVHAAAQPSHDKAASIPYDDFDVNAVGTLNLLEAIRRYSLDVPVVHLSTNKVYGDRPNLIPLIEHRTRWEYDDPGFESGISESFPIDQSKHSLFGASKVAADIMVQEYGLYFGMPTCCLRGGCLTGPNHSGVELHGFLSYLTKCNLTGTRYTINGYKGKQVRDNIHSYDVSRFAESFIRAPRIGEVYNIGGGKDNTCSILEAFSAIESLTGKRQNYTYSDAARSGDHICYYSDLAKASMHYPGWSISKPLDNIFEEITKAWISKLGK